jgi:DNA (cytosine-5)-methyltransferase 1
MLKRNWQSMKVLSLFSGVGGFDMGLENAGMQTVFQCEWDKHANTILNKHWPHVPKWDDVSTLTGEHILSKAPVIDVVAWGSPCQDLSVAGKRSGLEGERSGLFHEGIRIIKELRKETNGQYPRISIWENVVGALNSNRGADFGIIINEMAEAGAMVIEWAVLDAQYFGVPQRRRRVFVIAIFDPVLAERCPETLLPVAESLPGHLAKGKPARKSAATTLTESVGTDGQWPAGGNELGILRQSISSKWNKGSSGPSGDEYINMVVEDAPILIDRSAFNQGKNALYQTHISDDPISPSLVAQGPHAVFTKSSRAQTADDSETWVEGAVNPTLNSFDQGDVRATTAIVFENSYRDGARIANEGVTQTLSAKMGTGGGNTPMLAFDTQFGSNANVTENIAPTLKSSQAPPSVAYPIQDGRDIEKHQNGLGVGDEHSPAYTIDQTGAQAVAYGIQGSMIGRQDHNGPAGKGHTEEGDPMFTLTSTDVHAVSQEEPTVFQPGTMVRLNGGVWEGTVPTLRAESKRGDNEPHIQIHNAEPTMAVRRLTPLECERLMGWPDDHTRYKADGTEQADTHRYKQCGNGVASPVAQWIAKHLLKLEEQQ